MALPGRMSETCTFSVSSRPQFRHKRYNRHVKTLAVLLGLTLASGAFAAPIESKDRERIVSELQISRQMFLDAVLGLSDAQWTYKAGPTRWSIAEVAEHIIAAEGFIGDMVVQKIKDTPADPGKEAARKPAALKMDEGFLTQLRDRTRKAEAPGAIVPKGIYKTPVEAFTAFDAARAKTLEYVRTTDQPLRQHFFSPFPGSELDCVQGFLMVAGHNERHVLQILEVKQSPGYPK